MGNNLTPDEEENIAKAMNERIDALNKERFAIDECRGKGVTLDKNVELGNRRAEIEAELGQLKSKKA